MKNPQEYAAIILAAGASTRLGSFKPLVVLEGSTLVERVISAFSQNLVDVFLVTGFRHEELSAAVRDLDVVVVYNPDHRLGMLSSVQAGVQRLPPVYKGFFVMPVDIPLVRPSTIAELISMADRHSNQIVYPVYEGRRGHPVLVPANLDSVILNWHKEGGLKAILDTRRENALEVPVPDCNILFDIDTPEDFDEILRRYENFS